MDWNEIAQEGKKAVSYALDEACPDISQVTVQRFLAELLDRGDIIRTGGGRYTGYIWNYGKES